LDRAQPIRNSTTRMDDKKRLYVVFSAALIIIAGLVVWGFQSEKTEKAGGIEKVKEIAPVSEIIYFYGQGCSHCQDVNKFLEENKISEKISFSKKETWSSKENASELQQKAQECGLSPDQIGVPFVYSNGECFMGGPNVIEFFKKEAGI